MMRNVLREKGWLSGQPSHLQDAVLALGREQKFRAGAVVYTVGAPPAGCYAILEGQLAVTIAPTRNAPSLVHLAKPGTWYGEGSFLTREPRRVGLQAVVDTTLFHLPLVAMDRLTAEDPEWIRRFALILIANLDLALHAMDDLLIADPSRRVAAVLVRCLGDEETGTLWIAQSELGRVANVSRKVANRTLRDFADRGWITQGYGNIVVRDAAALRHYCQEP